MLSIPTAGVFSLCDALNASGRRADAEGQRKVKSEGSASAEETKDCSHHHRFFSMLTSGQRSWKRVIKDAILCFWHSQLVLAVQATLSR